MLKVALLLALGAICAVNSAKLIGTRTADMDFLHKQKKLYDLFFYVKQVDLVDAEWYKVGSSYEPEKYPTSFNDEKVVQKFFFYFNRGMFLPRNAVYSPYNKEQMYEMKMLFDLFYNANNFDTFYKTACWARLKINDSMFTAALTAAILYRHDCKYTRLPPIYEIYPDEFYNPELMQQAQYLKMTQIKPSPDHMVYEVIANYSGKFMSPFSGDEYKLDYFTEDIGLNAYYYYAKLMFPFWLSSKQYGMPKNFRGQYYYFMHQQLMAKYYLERMSNDMSDVPDFDWFKRMQPGYIPSMMLEDPMQFPMRSKFMQPGENKYVKLTQIRALEMRIMDAIDSGFLIDERGNKVDIYTPEGLELLANAIEGNVDSCNTKFYGMYDALARDILGFSIANQSKSAMMPNSLQCDCTSVKDPAFFMLYKKIMSYFFRYKKFCPQYTENELRLPGVSFESVNLDKLYTFFDTCKTLINNAVAVDSFKSGQSFRILACRSCLNYKPYCYNMSIKSERDMTATLRIFLGPYFEGVKQDMIYLQKYYNYFVEMDRFTVNLHSGSNSIDRCSSDSIFTVPDSGYSSDIYYNKLTRSIGGSEPFSYSERLFGFPERLTLPRGKPEGMKFKMFFFLSQQDEGSMSTIELPMMGKATFDGKPFGFPMDRPVWAWNYTIPNMYFKDVKIYNRPNAIAV